MTDMQDGDRPLEGIYAFGSHRQPRYMACNSHSHWCCPRGQDRGHVTPEGAARHLSSQMILAWKNEIRNRSH